MVIYAYMSRVFFFKATASRPGQARRGTTREGAPQAFGLAQAGLSKKADVSLGSLRRFEQTGDISFSSLVNICYALNCQDDLDDLFSKPSYRSIQEVIDEAR